MDLAKAEMSWLLVPDLGQVWSYNSPTATREHLLLDPPSLVNAPPVCNTGFSQDYITLMTSSGSVSQSSWRHELTSKLILMCEIGRKLKLEFYKLASFTLSENSCAAFAQDKMGKWLLLSSSLGVGAVSYIRYQISLMWCIKYASSLSQHHVGITNNTTVPAYSKTHISLFHSNINKKQINWRIAGL